MNATTKTIRMPQAMLDAWLKALRSGEYEQGRGILEAGGAFCCLGVLQMTVDGKTEKLVGKIASTYPSFDWLLAKGIEFTTGAGHCGETRNPYLPSLARSAADANDDGNYTFSQIADAIEACAEGY